MSTARTNVSEGTIYINYDRLLRLNAEDRIAEIASIGELEEGYDLLFQVYQLMKATVMVKRKEIWEKKCEWYGQYPGNQEDVDTINYVDKQIELLQHNPDIDLLEAVRAEIKKVLLEKQEQAKSKRKLAGAMYATTQPSQQQQNHNGEEPKQKRRK